MLPVALSVLCLGCGLYDPVFNFQQMHYIFISKTLRLALGPTWPPLLSLNARILFLGLKWTVCKADCSSSSNAKVKNEWSCTSLCPACPHGLHRDEFYLYYKG